MNFSAEIFIPDEKPKPSYQNYYSYASLALGCLSLYALKDTHNDFLAIALCLIMGLSFAFYFGVGFINMFTYMPLNGTLQENIIINDTSILIENKSYNISEVKNFKIEFNDNRGWPIARGRGSTLLGKSAGTNNFISFDFNDQQIKVQIRLLSIEHRKEIVPVIKQFIITNIMSCNDGVAMLKASYAMNTFEIKDLKKELGCEEED